jgi:glycosyltransferase involved in cell wall biosynthesis
MLGSFQVDRAVEASVIVCTHNPRPHYLRRVLEALRKQTAPTKKWELLLIDNASRAPLTLATCDISWHAHARIIREDELGLSSARRRGMRESSADLLVFVDDDNILNSNYLSEAVRINQEWPLLGVWGSGSICPEFEVLPPDDLEEFLGDLALREIKAPQWSNVFPCIDTIPWGAGLCVRAKVAAEYCRLDEGSALRISDRVGEALLSAGDVELSYVACSLGLGRGLFPELKLTHLMPKERLSEDYLVRIREGARTSDWLLQYKWQGVSPPFPFSPFGLLSVLKQILINRGIYRRMYLAELRAKLKARGIITVSESQDNAQYRSGGKNLFQA